MSLTTEQLRQRDGKLTASRIGVLMSGDEAELLDLWREMVGDPSYHAPDFDSIWPVQLGTVIFGECDCCGADNRVLHHAMAAGGVEAYACSECRYTDPKDEAFELEEEIEAIESDPKRDERKALLLTNLKAELARVMGE